MTPVRRDRRIATGVTSAQTANATSSGQSPGSRWSRRLMRASPPKKSVKRVGNRESPAELQRSLVHRIEGCRVVDPLHKVRDAVGDDHHLRLAHAPGGDERSSYPHAARVELRGVVERYGVACE